MDFKNSLEKIKQESKDLKEETKNKILGYIIGAFGLVAGLAWNEAIRALIDYFFPLTGTSLVFKFMYAILITVLVVIVSKYLINKK